MPKSNQGRRRRSTQRWLTQSHEDTKPKNRCGFVPWCENPQNRRISYTRDLVTRLPRFVVARHRDDNDNVVVHVPMAQFRRLQMRPRSIRNIGKLLSLIRRDIATRRHMPQADPESLDFYVDLRSTRYDRYLFKLLWTLTRNGSRVGLRPRQGLTSALRDWKTADIYGQLALTIDGLHWAAAAPSNRQDVIFVSDDASHPLAKENWKSVYIVDTRIDREPPAHQEWMMLPFLMHPRIYEQGLDRSASTLRVAERRLRCLFVGNIDRETYSPSALSPLKDHVGLMTRPEALDAIADALPTDRYAWAKSHEGIQQALRGEAEPQLLVDRMVVPIARDSWLPTLSQADFFLSLPGVRIPLCHNTVEAMSVGTIPILSHADWLHPALIDGENCLTYSGPQGLIDAIERALSMDEPELSSMRAAAIDYFETFQTPERINERLRARVSPGPIRLGLYTKAIGTLSRINRQSMIVQGVACLHGAACGD